MHRGYASYYRRESNANEGRKRRPFEKRRVAQFLTRRCERVQRWGLLHAVAMEPFHDAATDMPCTACLQAVHDLTSELIELM